jgi:tyrosine-protein kinase Etk/Wzc
MSARQAWPREDFQRLPLLPRGDAFGVRAMLDTLRQQRRPALVAFGLVLAATLLYGLLAAPVFKTDTLVQLSSRPRATLLPTLEEGGRGAAEGERREASGEIEVLRSRDVLLPVIETVGADVMIGGARRWGFVPVGSRHGIESVRLKVPPEFRGQDFALAVAGTAWTLLDDDGKELAKGASGSRTPFTLGGQAASIEVKLHADAPRVRVMVRQEHALKAYEAVVDRLRLFEPARESGVVRISYEDSDPQRAATLLNGLVAAYLELSVKRRADEGNEALNYLEGQLPPLEARVRAAEEALAKYQKSVAGVSTTVEAEALSRQRGDLERQLVELQVKRAQLAQNLTSEHPDVAAVQAQLASVRSALARTGASREVLPEQQRDLVRLQRDVQISTQQYTALLDRAQQLRIATASWLAGARQVDRAAAPVEPVRPKTMAVASIGLGLALLLAIVAALVSRALRTTVSNVIDIEATLGPATVASIPQSSNQPRLMAGRLDDAPETDMGTHRLLARAAPQDPAVEGLRAVHMSLLQRASSIESQVILVTAPAYGAGKSFVASNLAALMAESGKRVLLIEADMRHPAVYRYVGLDPHASGLSDVLCGARSLDEVIYPHTSANMDTLMQGAMTDNPGSLLLLPELATTLQTLRERYDHIVIHTPPLGAIGDALAFAPVADCFLLVVRPEQSLLDDTNDAVRRLERAGVRLEGVIFNGVRPSSRHSGFAPM